MLSWEQMDKLNETAKDGTKTANRRMTEIQDFMRTWAMLVCEDATALDFTPDWTEVRPPVIDASREATAARIAIPGQPGRSVCVGYYDHD